MNVLGKGKLNLKIEIEVLEMGIVLPRKEAHFFCKSKCYGELLKYHNCREKLKGIKQNFKVAHYSIEREHLSEENEQRTRVKSREIQQRELHLIYPNQYSETILRDAKKQVALVDKLLTFQNPFGGL